MPALEFCVPQGQAAGLLRTPPFTRPGRPAAIGWVWHDTAEAALSKAGLSLREGGGRWRLERTMPVPGEDWPPATPAPLVAEASSLAELAEAAAGLIPQTLMPVAGFRGRQWRVQGGLVSLTLIDGEMHGVARAAPSCRAVLDGPAADLAILIERLGPAVPLTVPAACWAVQAACLARGQALPPRRTGPPSIPAGSTLADAIALVIGHLTDELLAVAAQAAAGRSPHGVHQMRVAVRRLRSALSVFRRAVDSPSLAGLQPGLTTLATVLGAARDWDVFLGGTGPDVAAALPDEPRLQAMLAVAARRRQAAYAGLRAWLAGPDHQALILALVQAAALRPWQAADDPALLAPVSDYAAGELTHRTRRMMKAGGDIGAMPVEALHELRKQGKRLRYAAEFFAPLFGRRAGREFVGRLAVLQEALGHLNDAATAAKLTAALGNGAGQQFAAGAVQGFSAARTGDVRAGIAAAWKKFRKSEPFW